MEIEFDPAKDAANLDKQGMPLSTEANLVDDVAHLVVPSFREIDDGSPCSKAVHRAKRWRNASA